MGPTHIKKFFVAHLKLKFYPAFHVFIFIHNLTALSFAHGVLDFEYKGPPCRCHVGPEAAHCRCCADVQDRSCPEVLLGRGPLLGRRWRSSPHLSFQKPGKRGVLSAIFCGGEQTRSVIPNQGQSGSVWRLFWLSQLGVRPSITGI